MHPLWNNASYDSTRWRKRRKKETHRSSSTRSSIHWSLRYVGTRSSAARGHRTRERTQGIVMLLLLKRARSSGVAGRGRRGRSGVAEYRCRKGGSAGEGAASREIARLLYFGENIIINESAMQNIIVSSRLPEWSRHTATMVPSKVAMVPPPIRHRSV